MNNNDLISLYEKVAEITGDMLNAARTGNWDLLSELEKNCNHQVDSIREYDLTSMVNISEETRHKKITLIKKILADDKEIRTLTEPWMQHLASLMKNSSTTRKLTQAYSSNRAF
jgi:flagellar protein FliT